MVWSMQDQLKQGRKGELLLLKHWPVAIRRHEKFKGPDFVDAKGRVIELKTDFYDMGKTENFFVEKWSNRETQAPGGPWQALRKGSNILVYLFIKNRVWFVFDDLPGLVKELDRYLHVSQPKPIGIPNRGWVTEGYRVPRDALSHLYTETRLGGNK